MLADTLTTMHPFGAAENNNISPKPSRTFPLAMGGDDDAKRQKLSPSSSDQVNVGLVNPIGMSVPAMYARPPLLPSQLMAQQYHSAFGQQAPFGSYLMMNPPMQSLAGNPFGIRAASSPTSFASTALTYPVAPGQSHVSSLQTLLSHGHMSHQANEAALRGSFALHSGPGPINLSASSGSLTTSSLSPKGSEDSATVESKRRKKRESEGSRRTNLNDLVTVVEKAVLLDTNRVDRFADKVTVLECTVRLLNERYGLKAESQGAEYDSDSSNTSEPPIDFSQSNLDRNTKKTLRERQRRRTMNRHLQSLRRMLKIDESKDKKSVLHAVIDFLDEQRRLRGEDT